MATPLIYDSEIEHVNVFHNIAVIPSGSWGKQLSSAESNVELICDESRVALIPVDSQITQMSTIKCSGATVVSLGIGY